jgi:hypothetical protein
MVYEKLIIWTEKKKWNECNFMENKTEIIQYILKVKQISLLPK